MDSMSRLVTAPRTVIGYHGCSKEAAEQILVVRRFLPSQRAYGWLGEGVYFWEYAPYRALDWAIVKCDRKGDQPAVLQATIHLGRCLNLLDIRHVPNLERTYRKFFASIGEERIPVNTDQGAHFLDRAVIDAYCRGAGVSSRPHQTVRGSFAEGEPIYPGSKTLKKAHAQIAVRDPDCIRNVSLVTFR